MDWLDTPGEVSAVLAIGAIFVGILFWVVRAKVEQVLHETKPNSGSSMRDELMKRFDSIDTRMLSMENKIDHHIQWHLEDK